MSPLSSAGCLLKKIAMFVLWSAVLILCAQPASAQITVAPSSLTFAIPTGTPVIAPATTPSSAPQNVTINVTTGSVSFNPQFNSGTATAEITGANAAQFSISSNSCVGTLTAPANCQVAVVFSSSSSAQQTATLSISAFGFDNFNISLSGAYGAIKLFDSTLVAISQPSASFATPYTMAGQNLNLSCPASPSALLSGTPGYTVGVEVPVYGNLLVDNYVVLGINGAPVNIGSPAGNVCTGGVTDGFNNTTQQDCFTQAYRDAAIAGIITGANTDSLTQSVPNGEGPGGVAPIDVSSFFPSTASAVAATVSAVDAGGYQASSSMFLVTNCQLAGVSSGVTQTGVPITNNTNTQTQTFALDTAPNQNISYTTSDAVAIQSDTGSVGQVIPIVTLFGLSQTQFASLVQYTSAAPAVCIRLTGLLGMPDASGQSNLCAGFQIQCFNPGDGTTSGNNCGSSAARNLFDSAQFDSPDTPLPATFANTFSTSCTHYLSLLKISGTCASSSTGPNPSLIGPGFLMFGDSTTGPVCPLTTPFGTGPCPFDVLTTIKPGLDNGPGGSSAPSRNTIYVPVVNMPKPFTQASIHGHPDGWANSSSVQADFTSNQATYNPTITNPPSNGFTGVAPFSLNYWYALASQAPSDTTYPMTGLGTNYNTYTSMSLQNPPLCNLGGTTPSSFSSNSNSPSVGSPLPTLADGLYNLFYYTTDCALTEELLFNPTQNQLNDPTSNWASYPVLPFGVDTVPPTIAVAYPGGQTFTVNQAASVQYTCTDDRSGIGNCAGPLVPSCPSAPNPGPLSYTFSAPLNTAPAAIGPQSFQVTAQDCAGNNSTPVTVSYTVTAPSADVGLFEQETSDHVKPGGTLTYIVWALDLSKANAYNVAIAESIPANVLGGQITTQTAIVSCTLLGCSAMTNGTSCSTNSGSVLCNIPTLPSIYGLKGAVVKIMVPISKSVPVGTVFKINAMVSSANDPNSKNNALTDTITVTSN